METYLNEAFHAVCKAAQKAEGFYVSLIESVSYYGGPEEGGWWGHDHILQAYQHFSTQEEAEAAKEQVVRLAADLSKDAKRAHGEQCLRETAWLEARGLDDSFLPEPDGPSTFYVMVSKGIPESTYGSRHYE